MRKASERRAARSLGAMLLASICLAPILVGGTARADGGQGGAGPQGSGGGAGGTGFSGNPGQDGQDVPGNSGGGGGGGAGGGRGGNGVTFGSSRVIPGGAGGDGSNPNGRNGQDTSDPFSSSAGGGGGGRNGNDMGQATVNVTAPNALIGGNGGNGGNVIGLAGGGGGGGSGGHGAVILGTGLSSNTGGTIRGGNGGTGGADAGGSAATGGLGGTGGNGVVFAPSATGGSFTNSAFADVSGGTGGAVQLNGLRQSRADAAAGGAGIAGSGVTITNQGTITGGTGGQGQHSGSQWSNGGIGGAGIEAGDATTIVNAGTIRGGAGGDAPAPVSGFTNPVGGLGGVAIRGSNLRITNSGTISGGAPGANRSAPVANAIEFTGGANVLTLLGGSNITSTVVAGASDQLVLAGNRAGTADMSQLASFQHAYVTGGTWTLTGAAGNPNWQIEGGTLKVSNDAQIGTQPVGVNITGGTLQLGASFGSSHNIGINGDGGTIDTNGFDLTTSGFLAGSGNFTKSGAGTLAVTGNADLRNRVTVSGGTLKINPSNVRTDITNNATLGFDLSTDGSYAGVVSGTGNVVKSGAGTLRLTGANTYSGGTTLAGGTLLVNSDGNLGQAGGGLVFDGGALQAGAAFATTRGITLNAGGGRLGTDASALFLGNIGGTGGLTITGSGTVGLRGSNSYTGPTTINGALAIFEDANLGNGGGLILNGGRLLTGENIATARDITLDGGGGIFDVVRAGSFLAASGNISGDGRLTKAGPGTMSLTGTGTYTGGVTVSGGTLVGNTGNLKGDITNNGVVSFAQSAAGTYVGNMSGTGGLIKDGAGTLTLAGINSYRGGTTVSKGILQGNTSSLQGNIVNNGTVIFNQAAPGTYAGDMSGTGGLTKVGTDTLIVSGTNTYAGATNINEGVLRVGSVGGFSSGSTYTIAANASLDLNGFNQTIGALSGNGNVALGSARLTMGSNNSSTVANTAISGIGGSVIKVGRGELSLTGVNTYSGGTTINGGSIAVAAESGLGAATGSLTLNGGTLRWLAPFDLSASRAITLGAGGGSFDPVFGGGGGGPPVPVAIASDIGGVGGLTKIGSAPLVLTGTSSYAGATVVDSGDLIVRGPGVLSQQSAFRIGSNSALVIDNGFQQIGSLAGSGTLVLGNNTLEVGYDNTSTTYRGVIIGTDLPGPASGTLVKTGAGTLTLEQNETSNLSAITVAQGTLQIGDGGPYAANTVTNNGTLIFNRSDDYLFAGAIGGSGAVKHIGSGTVTLSGSNSYAGGTTINGGTLAVERDGNLGGPGGGLGFDGGALRFLSAFEVGAGRAITLNAGGGTFDTNGFDSTLGGHISGDGGLTKKGGGVLTVRGAGSYGGATSVDGGTLRAAAANLLSRNSAFTIASGAALDLNSFNQSIGSLAGGGNVLLGSGRLEAGGNNASTVFSGVLSGTGGLTKAGTGTLVLAGDNTYTGSTFVGQGGTLQIGNGGTTGAIAGNVVMAGLAPSTPGGTLAFNRSDNVTFGHALSQGTLQQLGSGVLTLSSGFNTQDFTAITNGTIATASDTNLGRQKTPDGQEPVIPGARLSFGSATTAGTLRFLGSFDSTRDITLNAGGGVFDTNGFNSAQNGAIVGVGGLTKAGSGSLTLTGALSYTGVTTVNGGTLKLTGDNSIASSRRLVVGAGATFDISGVSSFATSVRSIQGAGHFELGSKRLTLTDNNQTTVSGTIGGVGGSLVMAGGGALTLTGTNTYSGGTTINRGLVSIASDAALGAATGRVEVGGGTLQFGNAFNLAASRSLSVGLGDGTFDTNGFDTTFAQGVSGLGSLVKTGNGTLTLNGINTYEGGTMVTGGVLRIGNGGSLPIGALILSGGKLDLDNGSDGPISVGSLSGSGGTIDIGLSTLVVNQGSDSSYGGKLTGAGSLVKNGLGTLILSGVNTYTGPTSVNGGRLSVNGSITSDVTVGAAGNLGGSGTIFGNVTNAGTLAPGNSIGTLTVNGSFTQSAGSTYQVELNAAGQADRINVVGAPGSAALNGGTVQPVLTPGTYGRSTTYTILNATGGVSGTYAGRDRRQLRLPVSIAFLRRQQRLPHRQRPVRARCADGKPGGRGRRARPVQQRHLGRLRRRAGGAAEPRAGARPGGADGDQRPAVFRLRFGQRVGRAHVHERAGPADEPGARWLRRRHARGTGGGL